MQFWKDFSVAFKSWISILSSLVAAVSLFSLFVGWLQIPLAEIIRIALTAFRETFHPLVELLFGWIPIRWSPAIRDCVVLWLALGGAVFRTAFELALRRMRGGTFRYAYDVPLTLETALEYFAARRKWWPLIVPAMVIFWPIFVAIFFLTPFLVEETPGQFVVERSSQFTRNLLSRMKILICDFRVVFAFQLIAIIAAILTLAFANSALMNAKLPETT